MTLKRLRLLFTASLLMVCASIGWGKGIQVVPATQYLMNRAGTANDTIDKLLDTAKPSIGIDYVWGGTKLNKGIDCSNFTWQVFRKAGLPYERFLSTMTLARHRKGNGLRSISFNEARPGDLLVYGYRDHRKKWHGHVVILVDKDGRTTGHKGLVLGAHGGDIMEVQLVTYAGFEKNYFKEPRLKLCNVLRPES